MAKDSDLVRVTGLWKNQAKSGVEYLGGKITGESRDRLLGLLGTTESVQVMIFKNKEKKSEKSPDYSLTVSPTKGGGGGGGRMEDPPDEEAPPF
jgi:hypothetical protein